MSSAALKPSHAPLSHDQRRDSLFWWACAAGLVILVFICFAPALSAGFVSWDDPDNLINNPRYRALAPAHTLREMKPGHGVLVYGHLPPAKIAMRPWFKDPRLRRAANSGEQVEAVQAAR